MINLKDFIGKSVVDMNNNVGVISEVKDNLIIVQYKNRIGTYGDDSFDKNYLAFEDFESNLNFKMSRLKEETQANQIEVDKCLAELNSLTGLGEIKDQIADLICELKIYKYRNVFNLKVPNITRHMIFVGNPGTGKTTVARIIAQIYKSVGLLRKGQLIETDRSGLVAEYAGQTALKTKEVVKKALGGVLFIDEAYSLVISKKDAYGYEALDTLTKEIEDHRDDLVVIIAGYKKEMEEFVSANAGLSSRFKRVINFSDYTGQELYSIFKNMFLDNDYLLDKDADKFAKDYFSTIKSIPGNGRTMRNIFEESIKFQSRRISTIEDISKDLLVNITTDDLQKSLSLNC